MPPYKVIVADDHERARKAIRLLLDSDPDFRVVAEAVSGPDALDKVRAHRPDLVLMDIQMPEPNGLEVTRIVKRELPSVRVVILSVSDDAADLFEAIRCGAQGYLVKSVQPSDWIPYLRGVLDDRAPLSPEMAARLLAEFRPWPGSSQAGQGVLSDAAARLTQREREILALVSTGATNREIAAKLFISENTVKNHLKSIMAKLGLQNRVQLAAYGRRVST
ncbi:MAG: response regulator transcription factor [Alicyclobacillus sp.]|nr:response regulator transcription factor [Alicyclobacillus sp.]